MKLFECQNCGQLIYFENTQCERCGFPLGFLPDVAILTALKANGSGGYTPLAAPSRSVSYCTNFEQGACNWLVEEGSGPLCPACKLNRTIPDLTQQENLRRWRRIEVAKHRLVYSLLDSAFRSPAKSSSPRPGLPSISLRLFLGRMDKARF